MGGGQPSAPSAQKTATTQSAYDRTAAQTSQIMGNVNQYTPWGSSVYTPAGYETITDASGKQVQVPKYRQDVTLSPEQEALYYGQTNTGRLANYYAQLQLNNSGQLSQPIYMEGLPEAVTSLGDTDFSTDRRRVEDAIYSRLDRKFAEDDAALTTKLANQGLTPGSEAWNNAYRQFNEAKNDARMQAILSGGQEQSRLFDITERSGSFSNAARQQALQEQLNSRSQIINEISALLSGGQVTAPQFSEPYRSGVSSVDYTDMVQDQYDQALQNYQSQQTGLFKLGDSLLTGLFGLSDRRMKTDIKRVGTTDGGLPVYTFRYSFGGPVQMGVMADEVEQVHPGAVVTGSDGLKRVDYSQVR